MTTEHDKLIEDCAEEYSAVYNVSGGSHLEATRAALAIAVERCAAEAETSGAIARRIRALLSPNDRGEA